MNSQQSFQTFRVKQKKEENKSTVRLIFDQPLPGTEPGQFVMLWLPGIGEKPYSVLNDDPFSVAVTSVGIFSEKLNKLNIGERVWVRGPFGHGFRLTGSRHLLVGGGYGAAPLLFLARQARSFQHLVNVCLGARSAEDLVLVNDFRDLGCNVILTTNDGSVGENGLVTQTVESVNIQYKADTLYGCGPVGMLSVLGVYCQQKNLPSQLSWEAQMRCGIGLCGSCELDDAVRELAGIPVGWLTCKDGPVFINN